MLLILYSSLFSFYFPFNEYTQNCIVNIEKNRIGCINRGTNIRMRIFSQYKYMHVHYKMVTCSLCTIWFHTGLWRIAAQIYICRGQSLYLVLKKEQAYCFCALMHYKPRCCLPAYTHSKTKWIYTWTAAVSKLMLDVKRDIFYECNTLVLIIIVVAILTRVAINDKIIVVLSIRCLNRTLNHLHVDEKDAFPKI